MMLNKVNMQILYEAVLGKSKLLEVEASFYFLNISPISAKK